MAGNPCPELVFLAGPQQGRRVVVMGNAAVLGRGEEADIQAAEQYVSRQQLQFTLTHDGWVVENISSRPIRINGKKYKRKKKVLLDTGDLIGVGVSTEILFVGPGDDPEDALREYRRSKLVLAGEQPQQPSPLPVDAKADTAAPPAGGQPPAPASPAAAAAGGPELTAEPVEDEGPATRQLESVASEETRRKRRKYVIFFAVDIAVFLALVIWLSLGSNGTDGEAGGTPERLTREEIEAALTADRERVRNPARAELRLKEAQRHYGEIAWDPGALYRCVKAYKVSLAFSKQPTFDSFEDADKLREAEKLLVERVHRQYKRAWYLEEQYNWQDAQEAFEELLIMVPERDREDPAYEFVRNVKAHREYINKHITRED